MSNRKLVRISALSEASASWKQGPGLRLSDGMMRFSLPPPVNQRCQSKTRRIIARAWSTKQRISRKEMSNFEEVK